MNRNRYLGRTKVYSKGRQRFYVIWNWNEFIAKYEIDEIYLRKKDIEDFDNLKRAPFRLVKADKNIIDVKIERIRASESNF